MLHWPVFLSTVTPGKLPTFWFRPVNALNNEDLPLLGLPTNAMFMFFVKIDASELVRIWILSGSCKNSGYQWFIVTKLETRHYRNVKMRKYENEKKKKRAFIAYSSIVREN